MRFRKLALLVATIGWVLPGQASTPAQRPNPADYPSAVAWFDAVNKSSKSRGWGGLQKAVNVVGKTGAALVTFGAPFRTREGPLPEPFTRISKDAIAYKRYPLGKSDWNVPPYGRPLGDPSHQESHPEIAFADWCAAHAGTLTRPMAWTWACEGDRRFLAIIQWSDQVLLTVMEPKAGTDEERRQFTRLVQDAGVKFKFDSEQQVALRELVRQAEAQERLEKQRQQAPLRRTIGTRVCQDDRRSGATYAAFVERRSPDTDKVKLNVVSFAYKSNPSARITGFEPQVTWANPDDWYVCE